MAEFLSAHGELIPVTLPEVRRLVYRVVVRILAPPEAVLHWSHWRPAASGLRDAQPLPPSSVGSTGAAVEVD